MADQGVNWAGLAGLAVLVAGFGLLFVFTAILPARRQARAWDALAARRGWIVQRQNGSGGTATRIRVRPGPGEDWDAEVTRYRNGATRIHTTEYRAPLPRSGAGVVVIGPGLPPDQAAMAETMLGLLDGRLGQMLLQGLTDDVLAPHLAGLRQVPGVALPGALVLATDAAEAATLLARLAPDLPDWRSTGPEDAAAPVIVVTPEGIRLRLRQDAGPDRLERLIDTGRALSQGAAA